MDMPERRPKDDNRRSSPRNTILLPAETTIKLESRVIKLQSVIRDISLKGALISLARGEEAGLESETLLRNFEIAFLLPRIGEPVHAACASARIFRSEDGLLQIGVEFRHAPTDDLSRLKLYLSALESMRGPRPDKNGIRALVMDDDEIYRILVRNYLEQMGFEVEEAPDGRQGLHQFRENPADLVVVDILMPEKDGLETIRELKAVSADVDIIAISGGLRGMYNPLSAARAMGATRVLKKPFDREMLLSVLLSLPKRVRQLAALDLGLPEPAAGEAKA